MTTINAPLLDDTKSDADLEALKIFFDEKAGDIRSIIAEVNNLIAERRQINCELLHEIEQEIARAKQHLYELEQWHLEKWPDKNTFEREIQKLEQDKRRERVEVWRDLANLRKELLNYQRELNDIQRRVRLIQVTGTRGDLL